ncbi:MAG TPA: metal ABC transporter permease [Xanthobacteraceae bacterium]|jgi:zinc/manganese transport system permease protein
MYPAMYEFLFEPFADPAVRHSLAAIVALAFSAAPIGIFLMLRRMSLVGDAMAHAILPGVAIGFLVAGLDVFAMTLGGLAAGMVIALAAGAVSRATKLQEDASLAVFLLVSLALGVVIVTVNGIDIERLMTFLFGETAAKMSTDKLFVIAANSTVSLVALALIYRPLVLGCVDPGFLRSVSRADGIAHLTFLALLVLNLIDAFHALGTLLGVGIIIIPAGIARFWSRDISMMIALAIASALFSGWAGLLFAFHEDIPAGPAVTLAAGVLYIGSVLFGRFGGLVWQAFPGRHLEA